MWFMLHRSVIVQNNRLAYFAIPRYISRALSIFYLFSLVSAYL